MKLPNFIREDINIWLAIEKTQIRYQRMKRLNMNENINEKTSDFL